jgi:Bacteriophage Lambda NinG protein
MTNCSHGLPLEHTCTDCVQEGLERAAAHKPKSIKAKTCKICKAKFVPRRPMQSCCGYPMPCEATKADQLAAKSAARRAKTQRGETKQRLEAIKPRQKWLKEAEAAINKYVRLRDLQLGCVSCDKTAHWDGQWHASHFRSVGASSATRFHLWNIHKACSICNNWKSGNLSEYEPRLRAKIGDAKVDWLRTQTHTVVYSIEYLKRLKLIFQRKVKNLESRKRNSVA